MISVIITALNEPDLINTCMSLRETAGHLVEIIVVDDCSATPVVIPRDLLVRVVHNTVRCGVGPSRTIGVLHATSPYVLICDAHMRFPPGWTKPIEAYLYHQKDSVLCFSCVDMENDKAVYQGASLNVCGPDRANPKGALQILEGVWMPMQPKEPTMVACVMGGAYAMNKDWFLQISALKHLRGWGMDEPMLSIKTYLAGGQCWVIPEIRIRHKFRDRAPYTTQLHFPVYNKLFAIHTLCPPPLAQKLQHELRRVTPPRSFHPAETLLKSDWHLVATEQAYNRSIQRQTFEVYAGRFGLALP